MLAKLHTITQTLRDGREPDADPTVVPPKPTISEAERFRLENARDAAREALNNIKANARAAGKITVMALAVTMPHQMAFLLGVATLHLELSRRGLESLTVIAAAFLFPLMTDYLILICIRGLVARVGATSSKWWSGGALILLCAISGTINFIPDNDIVIRLIMVGAVAYIAISQILRVVGNRVDFEKVEKVKNEGAPPVATPTTIVRKPSRASRLKAADAAREMAKDNPKMSGAALARAAGVSPETARTILRDLRGGGPTPDGFLNGKKLPIPTSPAPAGRL